MATHVAGEAGASGTVTSLLSYLQNLTVLAGKVGIEQRDGSGLQRVVGPSLDE